MRPASLLSLTAAALALAGTTYAQTYQVTGILSSTAGSPIAHGHLTAASVSRDGDADITDRSSSAVTETDDHGRFVVRLRGPGDWKLAASAPGFRSSALDEHEGFFTGIVVTPTLPSVDVDFRLTPESSINGYVIDEAGEPVRTNAQVTLLRATEFPPDQPGPAWQARGVTRTDDRGHYEFAALAPGTYEVMVQAQPWYAVTAAQSRTVVQSDTSAATPPASPLDVAYPLTWYPGVTDQSGAGVLTLQGGETTQADLRLFPVPSIHLRLSLTTDNEIRAGIQLRLITPTGTSPYQVSGLRGADVGGLAPGTYEVTANDHPPAILHIGSGSPRTLDLSTAVPTASVTVHLDLPEDTAPAQVRFVDLDTSRSFPPEQGDGRSRGGPRAGDTDQPGDNPPLDLRSGRGSRSRGDRTVELPAGRYAVSLAGDQGQYLMSITATGAEATGRSVTIHGGSPELTLHIGIGRATAAGIATLHEKPAAGAMVLLVPAMLGDPRSLTVVRRDQANTDGSFLIRNVTPGQYILVAIDHGWHINWHDPATLSRYLVHGIPVDLAGTPATHLALEAQLP